MAVRKIVLALAAGAALAAAFGAQAASPQRCFGAVGMKCGSQLGPHADLVSAAICLPPPLVSFTNTGTCFISSGSILHDECCAAHPEGYMCGSDNTSSVCRPEWDRAVNRVVSFRSWTRPLDYSRINDTGKVVGPEYCGKKNARIRVNDTQYCCSGSSHRGNWMEAVVLGDASIRYCD